MKRIVRVRHSVQRVVRTLPGDALSGGRPRRVVITKTKTTTSSRRTAQ